MPYRKDPRSTYFMVLPVAFRRLAEDRFASEGAFADHLRLIRQRLGEEVSALVVAGTELSAERYEATKSSWKEIDETSEKIYFRSLHESDAGHFEFLRRIPSALALLWDNVGRSRVVHAGPAFLYRPLSFVALALGVLLGKVTISVTDIDERKTAKMNFETGVLSKKKYWFTRAVHEPWDDLQHRFIASQCSLVLLKGKKLAEDYGAGRPNVRDFLNAAHSAEHIIPEARLEEKLNRLGNPDEPLRLAYYGRLVPYKGIGEMLEAFRRARAVPGFAATFDIYGEGPERGELERRRGELGLTDAVRFHQGIPFGPRFFDTLYELDVLLATPLAEDTPRSAIDAQASGQYVVGYDTYYYRELEERGGAVSTVPWRHPEELAARLVALHEDRRALVDAIRRGVRFAAQNTQEVWLERRFTWIQEVLDAERRSSPPSRS